MNAVVLKRPGDLAVRSIADPVAGPGEVLVEVAWCGICGTDRSIYHGAYGGRRLPLTLGHEFAGRVVEDPDGVLAAGTPVVADINLSCGRCRACRLGDTMTCRRLEQIGVDRDGAFAPLVVVPARQVHVIPAGLALDAAALTEPLACVVHSQSKLAWHPGASVLVLGAGPAGILHALAAGARGASRVMLADLRPERLALLDGLEGVTLVDGAADPSARVHALTDGEGADIVIEASGSTAAYATAFAAVRSGGQVLAFGISAADAIVGVHPHDMVVRELTVRGSNGAGPAAWPAAIELLAAGRIDVSVLRAERIGLDEVVAQITGTPRDGALKALAAPGGVAA